MLCSFTRKNPASAGFSAAAHDGVTEARSPEGTPLSHHSALSRGISRHHRTTFLLPVAAPGHTQVYGRYCIAFKSRGWRCAGAARPRSPRAGAKSRPAGWPVSADARELGARGFGDAASRQFELPGNHSHSLVLMDDVSPETLGALIAATNTNVLSGGAARFNLDRAWS